uniref:Extended synaptotagmin-1 n=1 Tax=Anthurium amnicola TaxID=1678845 RepID=A0A1D1XN90_9ARAE
MFATLRGPASSNYLHACWALPSTCQCNTGKGGRPECWNLRAFSRFLSLKAFRLRWRCKASLRLPRSGNGVQRHKSVRQSVKSHNLSVVKHLSDELNYEEPSLEPPMQMASNFTNFREDPMVDKLRTQLGVIHHIPAPPINRTVVGLFALFFCFGIIFDKLWTWRKQGHIRETESGIRPQVPTSFSQFLEKDLQRKESVEWVNMVLGKLWKVYREGIENWIIGLLQPVIDNLKKPDYVQRVEIKQFYLGSEPLSVRNVERRTSRRANDLQYQIGLRYTGGARMLLSLSLRFGIIPIVVPVGVRDFDIDGELWVKLRLIQSEPWIGAVSWAFVSLPKIKFELSPFRLFNLMAIPVLSMFLTKLLTEDLPQLFVRPKKIVLDFQKGKAVGPVPDDFRTDTIQEGNKDFAGELSVTLVDARRVPYIFFAKTDPYVVLSLGDQVICSKKNSQTTVIGPPGEPIWNQDFHMLVANPRKQRLCIQVIDSFGFTDFTVGTGEIELGYLQDTVPTDRVIALRGRWGFFGKGSSGEILLRLTYKAYVEDEEDDAAKMELVDTDVSDDERDYEPNNVYKQEERGYTIGKEKESFMDVLAALIVSEEFQGIVASETGNFKFSEEPVNSESSASGPVDRNAEFSFLDSQTLSGSPGDALLWYAVITTAALLISMNVGGSSFFNP